MDVVTKSLLNEFVGTYDLSSLSPSEQFEYFCNFSAVSQHYSDSFDVSECSTGKFQGIDGVAVIANGALIENEDTIDELIETNGYLSASFVFVQAKTSSSFDLGEISKFSNSVIAFFEDTPYLTSQTDIKPFHNLKDAIYTQSAKFKRGNPQAHLYYITTGTWDNPDAIVAHITDTKNRLKALNIFSEISFYCIGAQQLQSWYRETQTSRTIQLNFEKSIALPSITGVEQAYLGALPANEFLKLLDDGSGGIVRSIFYENVRDYQRGSPVNEKIAATLKEKRGSEFVLRNNGVTVVATQLSRTGDIFTIKDYQIVNGCQTSNVLFDNREYVDENTYIPLKVIVTNNEYVRSQIIISSNSQNKVTEEQLWALEDFQKNLENYFQAHPDEGKLFYERRSRQYDAVPNVEKARIVTPSDLVRDFASMFLNEPHTAGRYYKELIGHIHSGSMFNPGHKIIPYYTSAYAAYRLAWLFRNRGFESKFKVFRFHILLAFKIIVVGDVSNSLNSNAIERICGKLEKVLHDQESSEVKFKLALNAVKNAAEDAGLPFLRDTARTSAFRDRVIEAAKALHTPESV